MSVVVRGLVCLGLLSSTALAHAEKPKHDAPVTHQPKPDAPVPHQAKAPPAVEASAAPAPIAAPEETPEASPRGPAAPPTLRVYMRTTGEPLTFSARARTNYGTPTWCVAPCDKRLPAGDYHLKLNGLDTDGSLALRQPGTWLGEYHSREAARTGGWLALNVGGIIGGVFITVGALGGPSWAYIAGGGAIAAGALTFVVSYRADTATVSFTPGEPLDVRGMPSAPEPASNNAATTRLDRSSPSSEARGLGLRIAF